MNILGDLRERLPSGETLYTWLAIIIIVAMIFGYTFFIASSLLPNIQARQELTSGLSIAEETLLNTQQSRASAEDRLVAQIEQAEVGLREAAAHFLSDDEATRILNQFYTYAGLAGVSVVDLQNLPSTPVEGAQPYKAHLFQLLVEGSITDLFTFMTKIEELEYHSLIIDQVSIGKSEDVWQLSLKVTILTSPFAKIKTETLEGTEDDGSDGVLPAPTVITTDDLQQTLHGEWSAGNWHQSIELIIKLLSFFPGDAELVEKLYAAHVNYGYEFLGNGQDDRAQEEFSLALSIKPSGKEAQEGFRQATGTVLPTPQVEQPALIIYVVQPDDTLYSISKKYDAPIEEIRTANGMTGNNIKVGQELQIPLQ